MMVMMMKIILKGQDAFSGRLSRMKSKLITKQAMGGMGAEAVKLIFERTVEQGKDKKGKALKAYKRKYLDYKRKRGGPHFSKQPNLFDGGDMMGDLQFSVEGRKRVYLHFPKTKENLKASGHIHGSRNLPKRDFFGLTNEERKKVLLIPKKHLEKTLAAD